MIKDDCFGYNRDVLVYHYYSVMVFRIIAAQKKYEEVLNLADENDEK